jgi:alanyl-tRNA synthetase
MHSNEVRSKFIEFFLSKDHSFVPSSSVVPTDDPTLLFANAGMNQFKPIFLGQIQPEVKRAVNSQKCIRAGGKHNDLEEVGKDGYHHTFFEMLGNWSFGDYYKKEAISWAWELLSEVYKLDKTRLHATVHDTDTESFELWKSLTDINPEQITYHGNKDNFWEMGDTGPCGPCSEIHYDRGEDSCEKRGVPGHVCAVNGDCSRYIEIWNLVFIQYNRSQEGELIPLANAYVDTGAGLERICQILQGVSSNYDTDLFQVLIQEISRLSQVPYSQETGVSHRVIADHIRSLCFALADGGFPSNEGRGYVLRRILRRAARHGRLLGFAEPFLWKLVDTLVQQMGGHFTELNGKADFIKMVIKAEEERFNRTLDTGLQKFNEFREASGNLISGKDAFMLYDTYGFPLDLTQILAEEHGKAVDNAGFEAEMLKQKERARASSKFASSLTDAEWIELSACAATKFMGYELDECQSSICRYSLAEDSSLQLILDQTPFYAESGGQVADTGRIVSPDFEIEITAVKKAPEGIIHIGKLQRGMISNTCATATIDSSLRRDTARNHTATHILHKALRQCLGEAVQQKGSLVSPDYLRFDFTHVKALSSEELRQVENQVNLIIRENKPVTTEEMDLEDAKAEGATALFGEKYSERVRVVSVQGYSKELCGGTHVHASGELGLFKIISESSSAAGIRRIEAITGRAAYQKTLELEDQLKELAAILNSNQAQVIQKAESLAHQLQHQALEIKNLKDKLIGFELQEYIATASDQGEYKLIASILKDDAELQSYRDVLATKLQGSVAILFSKSGEGVSVICVVAKDLTNRYHAGKIIQKISAELFGKGGGRPDFAMGGGKDTGKLENLLHRLPELISS